MTEPVVATAPGSIRWRVVAAVLVLAAVVSMVVWSDRPVAPGAEAATGTVAPSATPGSGSPDTAPAATRVAQPVQLLIPDLQMDTRLVTLGVRRDKTVEVPRDPDRAGWFRYGPPPGTLGSSVILGHRDSVEGPGVFAELPSLTPGARVQVTLDDGSTVTFEVRSVMTYLNEDFPARKVYGSHGRSELNLITCGGSYDADRGGYQANVVVNARRV